MFEAAAPLRREFADLEAALADPEVHADAGRARRLGRRCAELTGIIAALDECDALDADLAAARELAAEEPDFAAEVATLSERHEAAVARATRLLAPRDPDDGRDALMEIKSGEGGEESALFAGDLLRMYTRYAEGRGWKVTVLDQQATELGGVRSATVAIRATDPAVGAYGVLKFEGGVHRVQRVPVTETQGRIHTSAAGVLVFPEVDEDEVNVDESELRVDVFRSSGNGGQGVNTTDSAVRLTHLPTGIVVTCQNERSQLQNRQQALRVLLARLAAVRAAENAASAAANRRLQVRTVDRSERVRTYNFPENRFADHRIGFKSYNLDAVLDGDLQPVLDALAEADLAERLAEVNA